LYSFLFLLINCGTVNLWYWCGGKESGKKRLRLKGWTVAANSGGTERFADTGQAFASLPASGARVADKEPEERGRWTAHVEVKGWRVFLLFPAKTMTARSALHEATALIARAKRRQIKQSQPKPAATRRRAKHGSRWIFSFCLEARKARAKKTMEAAMRKRKERKRHDKLERSGTRRADGSFLYLKK